MMGYNIAYRLHEVGAMLEIAGGVVIGGAILFLMYVFMREIVIVVWWIVGIVAAILVCLGLIEAAIGAYHAYLRATGVNVPQDTAADGLFGFLVMGLIIGAIMLVAKGLEYLRTECIKSGEARSERRTNRASELTVADSVNPRRKRAQSILDQYYGTNSNTP